MYAGWSPFSLGRWCWYPGFGYTWISYEPWGWLPYHYGGWVFDPVFGWAWFPGAFGFWSPAQVSWYQGPGWIGWAPHTPPGQTLGGGKPTGGTGGQKGCPGGPGCIKGIPVQALASGKLITPTSLMSIDAAKAEPISKPEVSPALQARFTGALLPASPAVRARSSDVQRPSGVWYSAPSAVVSSARSNSNRGFNRPSPTSSSLTRSTRSFSGSSYSNPAFGVASRPAPQSAGSASFGRAGSTASSGFGTGSSHSGGGGFSSSGAGSVGGGSHSSGGGGSHH